MSSLTLVDCVDSQQHALPISNRSFQYVPCAWQTSKDAAQSHRSNDAFTDSLAQCFSTFLLQRNLPQMFALLMEPYATVKQYTTTNV